MTELSRRVREDDGVALLTVIGIMVVITILSIGSFVIARQTLHEAQRVEDEGRAFRVANSGLDMVLAQYSDELFEQYEGGVIPHETADGYAQITREQIGYGEWKLVSLGTGSDGTTETVTQRFFFMNLWEMNLAGVGSQSLMSGSGGLMGSSTIIGPFYMKGDLTIGANMGVYEGPLFVKDGSIKTTTAASALGAVDDPIDLFVTYDYPDAKSQGSIYIGSVSRSVPLITMPEIVAGDLEKAAQGAIAQSVDNVMGTREPQTANLESIGGNAATYTTMNPPNAGGWVRKRAPGASENYKFIGASDGSIAASGQGTRGLTIGGTGSWGSWGPVVIASTVTTEGVSVPGVNIPGDGHYPLTNAWDDFAYDDVNNRLYIEGTVFVDGPLIFAEDITYVGNGTIVANGVITIKGSLIPYHSPDAVDPNIQGEHNEWALGLVTPVNMDVLSTENSAFTRETARDEEPTLAGAFYASGIVHFTSNCLVRGSVIGGQIDSDHPNMCMVTNPLLPEYLPDSLPGSGSGLLMPTLWSRR
jgi:hypothetical protein